MLVRRLFSVLGCVSAVAVLGSSCASDLDALGEGKRCGPNAECAPGFVCDRARNACVSTVAQPKRDSGPDTGDAENEPAPDTSEHDATDADASEEDATLDRAADSEFDVVADVLVDTNCDAPLTFHADSDGDSFGSNVVLIVSCSPPAGAWVTRGGDCNDGDDRVFPGQTTYFGAGYTKGSGVSFDYDCSSAEDPDPSQLGAAPTCGLLGLLNCSGQGFGRTTRSGPGVNPLCGSVALVSCTPSLLTCDETTTQIGTPKRCR